MTIFIVNAGSSSLKFKLYEIKEQTRILAHGNCQRVGLDYSTIKYSNILGTQKSMIQLLKNHKDALQCIIQLMTAGDTAAIGSIKDIDAVGHRIANGGPSYNHSVLIDNAVLSEVERWGAVTPLHTPPQLLTIHACRELFSQDIPMIAGFDTAFHSTIPPENYLFAIPYELYEKHSIRKLGFHGLSHQYLVERYAQITEKSLAGSRIVTCHMGGGSSLSAVRDGVSIANTFGTGTGQGPMCGSRSGTVDHSMLGLIMERENMDYEQVQDLLQKRSGLLGVSGISSDEWEVEKAALGGDARAQLTIQMMVEQIKEYIGAYAFKMGGIDTLIFAGGIGENSDYCRELICKGLEEFGLVLDLCANTEHNRTEHRISATHSPVDIWIIPTDEESVIVKESVAILSSINRA